MNRKGTREQNDISIIRNLPKRLQRRIVEDVGENSLVTVVDTVYTQNDSGRPSTSTDGKVVAAHTMAKKHEDGSSIEQLAQKQQTPTKGIGEGVGGRAANVTHIGYFLQKSSLAVNDVSSLYKSSCKGEAEPVLETSGNAANSSITVKMKYDARSSNQTEGNVAIPGILRLNNVNQVQLIAVEKNKNLNEKTDRENDKKLIMRFPQFNDHFPKVSGILTTPVRQTQQQLKPPPWFELLTDVQYARSLPILYENVTLMMQQNLVVEQWSEFTTARHELERIFVKLLLQQLKLCCEQKIDTFFWKLLFYNVREYFISKCKSTCDDAQTHLLALFDEGLHFYTKLHMQLDAKYIDIQQQHHEQKTNNITQEKISTQRPTHKFEFIAKVAAQKLLICLGDLCRYKAKELKSNDYNDAAKYYQQAQTLIPTNGIPYNQLAIVAINARKKFDAVYFHMRSLMSSNAIYSARESLLVMFDEIRKKYEETELKTSPLHQHSPRHNNSSTSKSMRKEVWIHVDGVRRLHRASESEDNNRSKNILIKEEKRLNELDDEELVRRFKSLYLYVIGKVYTGIGMETVIEHQGKLLVQLNVLLKRSTLTIKRSRLLRIVALNIFILEQNMHKESRREIRYYAFNFCNQFFGLLLSKCNTLFTTFNSDVLGEQAKNHTDLNTFLQYINIYTDWLGRNVEIWEPLRNEEHVIIDTWSEWECLYVWLKHLLNKSTSGLPDNMLEEEIYLLGFTPIMSSRNMHNAKAHEIVERKDDGEQFFARIFKISTFNDCYAKNKSLLASDDAFTLEELNGAMEKMLCVVHNDEDDNSENVFVNGTNSVGCSNDTKTTSCEDIQISQLTQRRKELEARTNVKKQYNAKLDQILKFVDTKLYIEVRPRYLMPDTNCFIDCLDDFQKLIQQYKRYILVIPLTVVKELDGLSKGVKVDSYQNSLQMHRIHHYDDVSTCAKRSLDFIRSAKNNVKWQMLYTN
ncbi:telomerase-binding protein EST1A isoform X2 [Eurosta solidaginis]|uniref:telomerase-binding protein EST1A isoform X2 n=1 Tax=Eurosta solidaginis TaxID=178769 RepID=UPI0035317290